MDLVRSLPILAAFATILAPGAAAAEHGLDLPAPGDPQAQCHPEPFGVCIPHPPPIYPNDVLGSILVRIWPCC